MSLPFTHLLPQVDVVSFDLFDTLISRRCYAPDDVFLFLEHELIAQYGSSFQGFADQRKALDSVCRRKAWDTHQKEEISLKLIYEAFLERNPEISLSIDDLIQKEEAIERRALYPLGQAFEWIQSIQDAGKKVIITSDIYLDETFILKLLEDFGLNKVDKVYLSSKIGLLKHTGNLFDYILQNLDLPASKILHVGDNPISDIQRAKEKGLNTFLVTKPAELLDRVRFPFPKNQTSEARELSLGMGLSAKSTVRSTELMPDLGFQLGYEIGGPLLFGYLGFIIQEVRKIGPQKIFFLARDGDILMRNYNFIRSLNPNLPEAIYLHASRRALNFASITELDENTLSWLTEGVQLTVGQYLKRVGLEPIELLEPITQVGFFGPDELVREGHHYDQLRKLWPLIEPQLLKSAERERKNLLAYLIQKGVTSEKELVLIDVGWRTSIQFSFSQLLKSTAPHQTLHGFYLGTYKSAIERQSPQIRHYHYLMKYGEPIRAFEIIRHCVCLVEFFFASKEKTFLCVEETDGSLQPIFAEEHENEKDLQLLESLHLGMTQYVEDAAKLDPMIQVPFSSQTILKLLERILVTPREDEAKLLGNIHYADGFGAYFNHTFLAKPAGLKGLKLNKQKWKKDFKEAHWPMGYFAQLSPIEKFLFNRFHPKAKFVKYEH